MRKCLISVNVALLLSFSLFHFPLSGYLWVLECVCEFSLVSWRLEECCWFAFSVFTVGFKRTLSITNKRQHLHLQTWMNKLVVWAQYCSIDWYDIKICVTLQAACLEKEIIPSDFFFLLFGTHCTKMLCKDDLLCYQSAISEGMEMCHKPTWWEQVASSATWKGARSLTFVSCPDWHSLAPLKLIWLTVLIMLIRNLMMVMRGLRATAWSICVCWGGAVGGWG